MKEFADKNTLGSEPVSVLESEIKNQKIEYYPETTIVGYSVANDEVDDEPLQLHESIRNKKFVDTTDEIKSVDFNNFLFADIQKINKAKRKSLGMAFGFQDNESFFFWAEALIRIKLDADIRTFNAALTKEGEQTKVYFDGEKDYSIKIIYKEHRGKPPGASYRSFDLAYRRLGDLVTPMILGYYHVDENGEGPGAAVQRVNRIISSKYVKKKGKKFIDSLLDFFKKTWRRGVFDGDLFCLGGNRPGVSRSNDLIMLDFGSVQDAMQDSLFESRSPIGDDPFHMAIDKLHITRNRLDKISAPLARYFEEKLLQRFGIQLFTPEKWKKGRRGSRGQDFSIPLAAQLKRVVKKYRPIVSPSDHYALPFIGLATDQFVLHQISRRWEYYSKRGNKRWVEEVTERLHSLKETFPRYAKTISWLNSLPIISSDAIWFAYRFSNLEEVLSLLQNPSLMERFEIVLREFSRNEWFGKTTLGNAFLNDFNQTVLAMLVMSDYQRLSSSFVYLAEPSLLGKTALCQAFERAPLKFYQALERINGGYWRQDITDELEMLNFRRSWTILTQIDPQHGAEVLRESFCRDSLAFARIIMEIDDNHNVIRSFREFSKILELNNLNLIFRDDFFVFFNSLNVTSNTRQAFIKQWRFLTDNYIDEKSLTDALLEEPQFFLSTIPYLHRQSVSDLFEFGSLNVNRLLEKHRCKLLFVSSNVAGLNSTMGLVKLWRLSIQNYEIGLRNKMCEYANVARERFPVQTITTNLKSTPGRVVVRYLSEVDTPISRFPHAPFKSIFPSEINNAAKERLRKDLKLGTRKLIVVCSPLSSEVEIIMSALRGIARDSMPLVIVGMRDRDLRLEQIFSSEFDTIIRNNGEESLRHLAEHQLVVLNTNGELIKFLSIGDLAIVGMDRNVFEPASQRIPILYFDGPWYNNRLQIKLLSKFKGATKIVPRNLRGQITYLLSNPKSSITGINKSIEKFQRSTVPAASLISSLALTRLVNIANKRESRVVKRTSDSISPTINVTS